MRGRTRDRRVYLAGHPVLFALLVATRRWPALRLGGTVLVHGRDAYVAALTRVPLDRTADGTTGGAAGRLGGADTFFDQQGDAHRRTRRSTAEALGAAGVDRLRPVWTEILARRLAPLAAGAEVDLVPLAAELSGSTAAALLGLPVDGSALAEAARDAGAGAVREHLPGLFRGRARRAAAAAAERLTTLIAPEGGAEAGRAAMLAVAAINTSVAALPRAVAWCADDDLWSYARSHPRSLATELLRVTAPAPLLPRVAAAQSILPTGCPADDNHRPARTPPTGCPTGGGRRAVPTNTPPTRSPASRGGPATSTDTPPTRSPASGSATSTDTPPAGYSGHRDGRAGSADAQPTGYPGKGRTGAQLRIRRGDRLLLVARHAVGAHRDDPDPAEPATAQVAQLVFGIGPHACPGARLARAQLVDLLMALAPYRPVVVRSRADRRAALPGWRSLVVRASAAPVDAVGPPARTTAPPDRTALTTGPAPRGADTVDLALRTEDTSAPDTRTATARTAADRDPATPTRDAGA